jgi:ribonucleotide monophosphatase NagD (HAD superfamily)|tara:strand:- start:6245 stop:7300 length:1056 start_codon:yes stop_codon:yes gene_type:complete
VKTLIIPAAGKSSRYPNMRPKWTLTHPDGDLMIQKVMNSINYKKFDRVIITVIRDHCDTHNVDIILRQAFGENIEILVLENPTSSASETVYKTIKECEVTDQVVIKDSDCLVECSFSKNKNFIVGLTVDHDSKVDNIQSKSFIVKNDDDIVLDIVEKEIVSNIICLGVYSTIAENFVSAYDKIHNSHVNISSSEIYVSHVISYLILEDKMVFEYIEGDKFVDWGTKDDWFKEVRKHKTYIFDIDGVLLKNYGKYGKKNWSNTFEPIEKNIMTLKKLSDSGYELIFMTSRTEKYLKQFKDYMKLRGIKYKQIISGCNHGQRIIVNDFSNTNPYPSCHSISCKRNDYLENYIL